MARSAQYWCYFLDSTGSVGASEIIEQDGDDKAVSEALRMWEQRPHHHGIEVHNGGRRIHFEVRLPELPAVFKDTPRRIA